MAIWSGKDKADVGVLFVHGIGIHGRADALVANGGALVTATVAHELIKLLPAEECPDLYVSCGSGWEKLTQIQRVNDDERPWLPLIASTGLVMFTVTVPSTYRILFDVGGAATERSLLLVAVVVWVFVSSLAASLARTFPRITLLLAIAAGAIPLVFLARSGWWPTMLFFVSIPVMIVGTSLVMQPARKAASHGVGDDRDVPWIDIVSRHDPVPNGPLLTGAEIEHLLIESREIPIGGSMLTDHTRYWRSPEGLVVPLGQSLAEPGASPILDTMIEISGDLGSVVAKAEGQAGTGRLQEAMATLHPHAERARGAAKQRFEHLPAEYQKATEEETR